MPFEFGQTFGRFAKYTCGEGVLYQLTSNPIYLALLLTALVMITIIALIGEPTDGILEKKDFIKLGIYILVVTCIIISVHHYTYLKALNEYQSKNGVSKIYNTINDLSTSSNMNNFPIPIGAGEDVPSVAGGFDSSIVHENTELTNNSDVIEEVNLDL